MITTKLLTLFVFSILLSGCCLRGHEDVQLFVPDKVKNFVPYVDQQTLPFLKLNGDTVPVMISRAQFFQNESCAECYCLSTESEFQEINFSSATDPSLLFLILKAEDPRLLFSNQDSGFELLVDDSESGVCDSTLVSCLDSMIIQGKIYYNVYQLERRMTLLPNTNVLHVFYNAQKGVLRIEWNDGTTLDVL